MKKIEITTLNEIREIRSKNFEIDSTLEINFTGKNDKREKLYITSDQGLKRYLFGYNFVNTTSKTKIFTSLKELKEFAIDEAKKLGLKDSNKKSIVGDLGLVSFEVEILKNTNEFNLKTVADLKRLPVGTFLRRNYTSKVDKLGTFVKIKSVQSNSINLLYDEEKNVTSSLDFPTAADSKIDGNIIVYYVPGTKEIDLVYEVFKDEGLSLEQMREKYKNDKIISNFSANEIEGLNRTMKIVILYLKNGNIAFIKNDVNFELLGISSNKELEKTYISQYFNGKENDERFSNSRLMTEIYYSINKDFNIALVKEDYKIFKNLEIVWNEEIGKNLIKGDGKYYEYFEDDNNIPKGRNYGIGKIIEYNGKLDFKNEKNKTIEEIEKISIDKHKEDDILKKVSILHGSNYQSFVEIPLEESLSIIKEYKSLKLEDEVNEIDYNFTTKTEESKIWIGITIRKNRKYILIGIKKLKHIEISQKEIEEIENLYNEIKSRLEILEETFKAQNPVIILEGYLEKELEGYPRREAKVTFKDGRIEKLRLFKGSRGFGYLKKGSSRNGYLLDLEKIEKINFN